jgi:hypothetical protein
VLRDVRELVRIHTKKGMFPNARDSRVLANISSKRFTPRNRDLFLPGPAYPQNAIFIIEERVLKLEGICKRISAEAAAELRFCYIHNRRYAASRSEIKIAHFRQNRHRPKLQAYQGLLADSTNRWQAPEEEHMRPRMFRRSL